MRTDEEVEAAWAAATERVERTPELLPFRDLLLEYAWPNMDEHLQWVQDAPEADIVAWAERCRRDEEAEAEE